MTTLLAALLACTPDAPETAPPPAPVAEPAPAAPVLEPLEGGPFPALLLAQAQFVKGADGKQKPGPALLTIWRQTAQGWKATRLEDPESNVFHKAIPYEGGILTIGAEDAWLKKWTFKDGAWAQDKLWTKSWGGKFDRLRDLEIGDVDGDGQDELVIATHDMGVVAVARMREGKAEVTELGAAPDTFVHEIELGDVDGDGRKEIYCTPSGRNQSSGKSQPGKVARWAWDGTAFQGSVVDDLGESHAKEILAVDLDGKGRATLFSVVEAETRLVDGKPQKVKDVEVRQYALGKGGAWTHTVAATIDDLQTRFLVPGDFDHDGSVDLVAAAMKSGIWLLRRDAKDWNAENIERTSSGFEHAAWGADLDGDGKLELYVASDEQRELRRYAWDPASKVFTRTVLGPIPKGAMTWNITSGKL
jgi:hypothetical protein